MTTPPRALLLSYICARACLRLRLRLRLRCLFVSTRLWVCVCARIHLSVSVLPPPLSLCFLIVSFSLSFCKCVKPKSYSYCSPNVQYIEITTVSTQFIRAIGVTLFWFADFPLCAARTPCIMDHRNTRRITDNRHASLQEAGIATVGEEDAAKVFDDCESCGPDT